METSGYFNFTKTLKFSEKNHFLWGVYTNLFNHSLSKRIRDKLLTYKLKSEDNYRPMYNNWRQMLLDRVAQIFEEKQSRIEDFLQIFFVIASFVLVGFSYKV